MINIVAFIIHLGISQSKYGSFKTFLNVKTYGGFLWVYFFKVFPNLGVFYCG